MASHLLDHLQYAMMHYKKHGNGNISHLCKKTHQHSNLAVTELHVGGIIQVKAESEEQKE